MDTTVIGAGVSGLALAGFRHKDSGLLLCEASAELGGLVRSERIDGAVIQWGANGFLNNEPAVDELMELLGLSPLHAKGGDRFLLHRGQPTALPAKPQQILSSPLLSLWAKIRLLMEPLKGLRTEEQTVKDYLQHRLGRGVTQAFADAFVSGIWAGDPGELSMQAAFPRLVAQVEAHGSLLGAMKAKKKSGSPAPVLTSFEGGLSAIGKAVEKLGAGRIRRNCLVSSMAPSENGWVLETSTGLIQTQRVVLALSAGRSAKLLKPIAPEAAALLEAIPTAPVAVVHTRFPVQGWTPPSGFGILCPHREERHSLGVLFTSSIFPTHSTNNEVVVRSILGGRRSPELVNEDPQTIQQLALADLKRFLPGCPSPISQHCIVHREGIPQYTLGHQKRIASVRRGVAHLPGLHLIGNYIEGVAVKDCIRVARDCALSLDHP